MPLFSHQQSLKTVLNLNEVQSAKQNTSPVSIKPPPSLIKWSGSKRAQAKEIVSYFPSYNRFFEPFLGGGAVLYYAARPGSFAGDIYRPLIDFWKLVQSNPELVIEDYRIQWTKLQTDLPDYFYRVRERFNLGPNALDLSFLMRTCVNGIVRFNDSGEFNNSFHLSRRGMTPERFSTIVAKWSDRIQDVDFVCEDYTTTIELAKPGDFVYFDPPYAGTKQRYASEINPNDFFSVLDALNSRGIKWALSYDGKRGLSDFTQEIPNELYKRHLFLSNGNSAVGKVLNGTLETVLESLYLNF